MYKNCWKVVLQNSFRHCDINRGVFPVSNSSRKCAMVKYQREQNNKHENYQPTIYTIFHHNMHIHITGCLVREERFQTGHLIPEYALIICEPSKVLFREKLSKVITISNTIPSLIGSRRWDVMSVSTKRHCNSIIMRSEISNYRKEWNYPYYT